MSQFLLANLATINPAVVPLGGTKEDIMEEITLQALLEAGCHFGHKAERWNPRARDFIYIEKDGIHIIDLAKTKAGLEAAVNFIKDLVASGEEVLFVGTKRQARGVVKQEVEAVGAPYFVERWVGGFLTNFESVKKNIDKIINLTNEREAGGWKKFPKHEQSKLSRYIEKLKVYYGGVLKVTKLPAALFIVDIKKETAAFREAQRIGIPIIAIVDTNSDPTGVNYMIPANDDAVGSIQYITHVVALAYKEGKAIFAKQEAKAEKAKEVAPAAQVIPATPEAPKKQEAQEAPKKTRGRPKKKDTNTTNKNTN